MNHAGMDPLISDIREFIEEKLDQGYRKFIIYPFGDVGMRVKEILNTAYGIQEDYIIDNKLCKYNKKIRELSDLIRGGTKIKEYAVLLSSTNSDIYSELKNTVLELFEEKQIAELSCMKNKKDDSNITLWHTSIGKYSYGPICHDHKLIKSIGSFCSFAAGVDVVQNHEIRYLTTHPMIYEGKNIEEIDMDYNCFRNFPWYFEGVQPKEIVMKNRRCTIGNDVWLGKNVTITNGVNIGNGVIAGAGAVITKDVPDYAIVMGVPARIVRFRYSEEEIAELNKIKWWDWTNEEIRERYDDFYLPIEEFIRKWKVD